MKVYQNIFEQIICLENLFSAWDKFRSDKKERRDVQKFEWRLEENIFQLHRDLINRKYRHGRYSSFYIKDPKQRHIHKATVRDRILHHAVFSIINPMFEPTFISTSFSCRIGYGTHRGVATLAKMMRKVSQNNTQPCYVLKCDIKKFFDSVDHSILFSILGRRIRDENAMWLLEEIIESFPKGLPIGNLTSQIFANIYMNEFDQFVKHELKMKYYVRYTDDFAILSDNEYTLRGGAYKYRKVSRKAFEAAASPKEGFCAKVASRD